MKKSEDYVRNQLADQIRGGNAFIKIEKILEMVDFDQVGMRFPGLPYSYWQQLEHLRITQQDILEFSRNGDYKPLDWPEDYWSEEKAPSSIEHWELSKKNFIRDRENFLALLLDTKIDLFEPFVHGEGQTLFREALLILEHNAYHTGQLLILARLIKENQESK